MNNKTKARLKEFICQVEVLAQGVIHLTGERDCKILLESAEALKLQLDKDETIS